MNGPIRLDDRVRVLDGSCLLVGGDPPRMLRLSAAGARTLVALQSELPPLDAAAQSLKTRLIGAGLAHPCPQRISRPHVTVVIPVRNRPAELERCLAAVAGERVIVVDDGSQDGAAVAAICERHGAERIRRDVSGGPGAARNAALAHVDSELIAFLDSDCVPQPGWLELLAGALSDPEVGAAAPRIRPLTDTGGGAVARFAAVRSPLDLGDHPGEVKPGGRIAYVPSAALLVRRAALGSGFDPALRYGEDVDLVWRLHDAGWRIRYEPAAVVRHSEPESWRALAIRRLHYGAAAGPLARRHPERLAPVVIQPRPATMIALALAGQPAAALAAAALDLGLNVRRLGRVGVPPSVAAAIGVRGLIGSAAAIGQAGTMLAPEFMVAGLIRRRTRPATLALVVAQPLRGWIRLSGGQRRSPSHRSPGRTSAEQPRLLDPVRFTALSLADDVAYGMGVWSGAMRERTWRPLRPALARRAQTPPPVGASHIHTVMPQPK